MLEQILMHLNNWFLVPNGVHEGTYTIEDGGIALPFLTNGQYFRVIGSIFNDGLHHYPETEMNEETFDGVIWALAVPKQVVALADEIQAWTDKQGSPSPYTSESFGGYSYSKATNTNGAPLGWQDVFKAQLNPYRKLRETGFVQPTKPARPFYFPFNPDYPFGGGI